MIKYACKKLPDHVTPEEINKRIVWGFLRNFGGLKEASDYLENEIIKFSETD